MGQMRKRETVYKDPRSKNFSGRRLWWSVWREAIVPNKVGSQNEERYTARNFGRGAWKHYYNNKTLRKLERSCNNNGRCCGIYELKVVPRSLEGDEAVVYIGSTHRQEGMSLYQRLYEYMKNSSHIKKIIQGALNEDFEIHVRWIKITEDICPGEDEDEDREVPEELENAYLEKFDYAWNKRLNHKRREILGIRVAR